MNTVHIDIYSRKSFKDKKLKFKYLELVKTMQLCEEKGVDEDKDKIDFYLL